MMFSMAFSNSFERIVAGLLFDSLKSFVNDLLSDALLAIQHDAVDQTGDELGIVNRISQRLRALRFYLFWASFFPPSH